MTMETYHWEHKHLTDPPTTLSIMRTLPDGDWTVRCEDWTLPAEFPAQYDRLESAMRAADELVKTHRDHECDVSGWVSGCQCHPNLKTSPQGAFNTRSSTPFNQEQ